MHDATNVGEEPSLHITVGLLVKKWADLMLEVLSEVAVNSPKFRESLPVGFAKKDFDVTNAKAHFTELIEIFAGEANFENVFDLFKQEYYRTRKPNLKGALLQSSGEMDSEMTYRIRDNFQYSLKVDEGQMVLSCAGGDLKFSSRAADALGAVLKGEPFTQDLFKDLPTKEVTDMVQKLLAFGAIQKTD